MRDRNIFLLILVIFIQLNIIAQENVDTSLLIDQIYISGQRIDIPFNEYGRNIDIISKEEIDKSPATSISELLQYHGAIDVRRRGVNGVQSDIGIRGSSFNQVLVMIDGTPMSDPQTGHHMMNLPVPLSAVQRIEVLKGAAARVYGQNAMAGAINIVTRSAYKKKTGVELFSNYGSFNSWGLGARWKTSSENYDQTITLNHSSSDGYKYNTDYKINNALYQSKLKLNTRNVIDFSGGISTRKFGANGFYANEDFKDQYEETKTSFLSANTKFVLDQFIIKPRISWRRNNDIYLFLRHDPDFYRNEHTSSVFQTAINATYLSILGTSGIGIEYSNESLVSNNLGNHHRDILGVYIEHRFQFFEDRLDLTVGLYTSMILKGETQMNPGLDVSYSLSHDWSMFSSINRGSRLPTYTNLYYTSRAEQGNEALKSESALSYELGTRYNNGIFNTTISGFIRNNRNLIDWAKQYSSQEKWMALNFNQVNIKGLDWINTINWSKIFALENDIYMNIDYTYILSEVIDNKEILISRYALNNLRQQFLIGLNVELYKGLNLGTYFRYLDRVSLEDYKLLDANLSYSHRQYKVNLKVNNATNTTYRETNLVEMPGRWFEVGFSINLL